jgi:metal-responsive CopG/Arc/MetJ family transcriptional regulator
MAVTYEKTYRPIHLNVDAELLGRLDEYKSSTMPRSQHIHAALRMYVEHLEKQGARKSVWLIGQRTKDSK